jgi:1-deoxy-D-xylulose-5-phosphate reductoisomerase
MRDVTPQEAVAHPNWSMGAKISVDSATMMNKGLEVIEAHHLFRLSLERIDIVVHPQSIVHSAVVYRDGSVLAQLGSPDMRTPIAYALAWPDRIETPAKRLDLAAVGRLTFEPPDEQRFPAPRCSRGANPRWWVPDRLERGERDCRACFSGGAHRVSRHRRNSRTYSREYAGGQT